MFLEVATVIAEKMRVDVDKITPTSTFDDLEVDSLDLIEIVMDLEEQFGVTIDNNQNLKNVADLVSYIESNKTK